MRSEKTGRDRYLLVRRWPSPAEATPQAPAQRESASASTALAEPVPQRADEQSLFRELEAEIREVLPGAEGDRLCAMLAGPKLAFRSNRGAESRAALLDALDLVEDVLDALLLVRSARPEREDRGARP